ncbi:MAG: VacJ family lipoprotein [Alphaproteobacteria bacterium]
MLRILAVLLTLAVLSTAYSFTASAQSLPLDMVERIAAAADEGRRHQASLGDIIDERRQIANRQLETVVVSAIVERPGLFQAIMQEAYRQAPESQANLNVTVVSMFPGFAGALPQPSREPPRRAAPETPRVVPPPDVRAQDIVRARAPAERPPDWPILPKDGGIDGYADKDPLEGLNLVFLYANGALDILVFEPLARGYRFITPEVAQNALGRAFDNLASPIIFANNLLQLRFQRAAVTFSRFAINSTVGVLGLFDVAAELGLEGHDADFGQTLYVYGVGDGIYLVLPFFGPTTARDAIGLGVDSLFDPRTWFLGSTERLALYAGEGVVRREELIEAVNYLIENAESNYDAVRAWTYQQRQLELSE